METNTKNDMVDFDKLTDDQRKMVEEVFEEFAIIFASTLLRIEKAFDNLKDELYKGVIE